MNFRALDPLGDWSFGNGEQDYASAQNAIVLDIQTALRTFLGECFFAVNFGVDWWNLLGGKDAVGIVLQCRQMIAARDGVTRINSVDSSIDVNSRRLTLTFNVDTIYSKNQTANIQVP